MHEYGFLSINTRIAPSWCSNQSSPTRNLYMTRLPPSHPSGIKRLQVGCGPHNILPDWWNVDLRSFPGIDEVMDVTESWPWENTLDYVYGEHFVEHLSIDECISFLRNSHKALKENGRIRISTPSLEWVMSSHFTLGVRNEDSDVNQTFAINRAFYGWGHKFLYSKSMLRVLFECTGFNKIEFHKYGDSRTVDLINIERHGGYQIDNGYPSVWIIECSKSDVFTEKLDSLTSIIKNSFLKHVESGH